MSRERPRILLAGGGTGGHLFPALAIADEIKKNVPEVEILFIGTKDKIEARVVPQCGYAFQTIWISGLHRSLRVSNLLFPFKLVVSLAQSFLLIKRFQPDVVVGTGGYVSGPILSAATWSGIPTVIHESNSYPGITTRMLARGATAVFTGFEVSTHWLKRTDNVELVGTPTRDALDRVSKIEATKFFGLDVNKKTVLVFGGSLGAASINDAIVSMVEEFKKRGVQCIWQTGEKDFRQLRERVQNKFSGWMGPFIERMDMAYAAADVVVCRSGATTLAELTKLGKPAVLIPFPYAAADHQTLNAKTLADAGAARMIADKDVSTKLQDELFELLESELKRTSMCEASRRLGRPDAGRAIARRILQLIR